MVMARKRQSAAESLAARIKVAHDDVKHLPRLSRIALTNHSVRRGLTSGFHSVSIGPRRSWQASAPAANQSGLLCNNETCLERPIRDLARGRTQSCQGTRTLVLEGIRYDGFQNSAGRHHGQIVISFFEGGPAISVSLLKHRPNLGIVNELESPGRWLLRRCRNNRRIVRSRERSNRLSEDAEKLLNDLGGRSPLGRTTIRGAHQESFTKRPREPMRFAASRELVDRHAAVFLPAAGRRDRRRVGWIGGQRVSKLMPATDQAVEVGKVGLDLCSQAVFDRHRLGVLQFFAKEYVGN
jgi:hypothetical protein